MRTDWELMAALLVREPRSTLGLAAWSTAASPRHVNVIHTGRSACILVRSEPMVWIGYPQLFDPLDAPALARLIDRSPAVGLEGHPDDVEPLLDHLVRTGEVGRFRRMVASREECGWTAADDSTRVAAMVDVPAVVSLFEDYEVRFVASATRRARYLERAVQRHSVLVHGPVGSVDAAAITGGVTPGYLVFEHLRVADHARGRGISWKLVYRLVEIAQAYGVGLLGSATDANPMTMPTDRGRMETQVSVNLRLPDRWPGERRIRRNALRVVRYR
ncbi:MAG: hypothetical protein ACK5O2_11265 [Microthrixaceae bacterium]